MLLERKVLLRSRLLFHIVHSPNETQGAVENSIKLFKVESAAGDTSTVIQRYGVHINSEAAELGRTSFALGIGGTFTFIV